MHELIIDSQPCSLSDIAMFDFESMRMLRDGKIATTKQKMRMKTKLCQKLKKKQKTKNETREKMNGQRNENN